MFLGPTGVCSTTSTLTGSAIFAGLMVVTNTYTDSHAPYTVYTCSNSLQTEWTRCMLIKMLSEVLIRIH